MKAKKFFEKSHNILFLTSAVMFLQFLLFVIYYFMQVVVFHEVNDSVYFVYIPYCLAVCMICGFYIIKKKQEKKGLDSVKLWFSGFFLYAFCEILLFLKLMWEYENNIEFAYNLFDNQPLYKLYLCIAVIFLIYGVFYILEKKKIYVFLTVINLLLFGFLYYPPRKRRNFF